MSRVKSIDGLYFTGQYRRSAFNCNTKVNKEYARTKEQQLAKLADFLQTSCSLNICLLNIKSLRRHAVDIYHDEFLYKNDILCFLAFSAKFFKILRPRKFIPAKYLIFFEFFKFFVFSNLF